MNSKGLRSSSSKTLQYHRHSDHRREKSYKFTRILTSASLPGPRCRITQPLPNQEPGYTAAGTSCRITQPLPSQEVSRQREQATGTGEMRERGAIIIKYTMNSKGLRSSSSKTIQYCRHSDHRHEQFYKFTRILTSASLPGPRCRITQPLPNQEVSRQREQAGVHDSMPHYPTII